MENKFRNLVPEPTTPSFAKGKFIEAPEHQRHPGRREPRCPTRQRLSNRWHAPLDSLDRRWGANALAQQGVQSSSRLARWLAVAPCATLNPRSSPKWSNNLGVLRQTPESGGGLGVNLEPWASSPHRTTTPTGSCGARWGLPNLHQRDTTYRLRGQGNEAQQTDDASRTTARA